MHFTRAIAAAILAFTATGVLAVPVPQLAGEGAAANSILSGTDNAVGFGVENAEDNIAGNIKQVKGSAPATPAKRQLAGEGAAANSILSGTDNAVGFGVENAEDNIAGNISQVKGSVPAKRQLAGEGAAADSILTDTDNGVGYGTENAEDNIADTISKLTGNSAGGSGGNPPPPPPPHKRQLDKIAKGAQAIGDAAGVGAETQPATDAAVSADGTLTSGAANAGAQVGSTEETTLENVGSSVPKSKRQLDKIAKGAQAIGDAAGVGAETQPATDAAVSADGTLTSGAANAGAQVGSTEETTLENAGSSVPKSRRQLDKIAKGAQAIGDAAGVGTETQPATDAAVNADGTLTSGAANAGAQIGSTEESTLENAGSQVPRSFRA